MISIISCSPRSTSNSEQISNLLLEICALRGAKVQIFYLKDLPSDILNLTYFDGSKSEFLQQILKKYFTFSDKYIFVIPEYNGSFPGIFKLLIDVLPQETFANKKIAMLGVANGRGGNTRGMDHMAGVFHYLKAMVYPHLLPISNVEQFLGERGKDLGNKKNILSDYVDGVLGF